MDKIDSLIERAKGVQNEPYRSPKYDLWKHDAHRLVEANFGSDLVKMFDRIISPSSVIIGDSDNNLVVKRNERIQRAIEFLEELKSRDAESDLSSSTQTMAQAKEAVQARFDRTHISVHGNATFGDNSPLNQIQISEFITALINEAEKLPDGPEKKGLLQNLKAVLENPTIASLAGGVVGGIVQGLVK